MHEYFFLFMKRAMIYRYINKSNKALDLFLIVWKRIGVMVCKKSAYPNCSGALTNCSGRLITVPEDF